MPATQRPLLALALRLGSALMLSALYLVVKLAARSGVSLVELMFWRQAASLPLLFGWLALRGSLGSLVTRRLAGHGWRAVLGTFGMLANFGASILLPLAVASILGFTAPLFAVIITALVLRKQVGRSRWLAVLLGFAGVLVIARPGAMPVSPLGALAGIGSGLMVALVSLQIRELGRTESPAATPCFTSRSSARCFWPR